MKVQIPLIRTGMEDSGISENALPLSVWNKNRTEACLNVIKDIAIE